MDDAPCLVHRIVIRGNSLTHSSVIDQELRHVRASTTLGALAHSCLAASAALRSLNVFDAVDILCDAAPPAADGTPQADVRVTLREKRRLATASTGVHTEGSAASVDAAFALGNACGRAERIEAHVQLGQQKASSLRAALSKPRVGGRDAALSAELRKQQSPHLKHSSFTQKENTLRLSCLMGRPDGPTGAHELTYEASLREVCKLPSTASWAVLQQRGISLKSAVRHTFSLSSLDHPAVPTQGYAFKLVNELAGVGKLGDARFHKHSVEAALYQPLLSDGLLTLSLEARAGALLPLGGSYAAGGKAASCICDRFFMGGPGSFWGFRSNGLGPRGERHGGGASRDSLGGDVMAAASASLSAPLPGRFKQLGARAHLFASAGGLEAYPLASPLSSALRACAGAGVSLPTALGRLQLNFTQVLKRRPADSVQRSGWQIGLSSIFF
ncbi:hypothetical protein AB1Y20_016409 [Prymnesium parvum]|uniref:Bacterial surface antigen (D15) domain-containing protein n=1 Tax=Prymnesium parvum TaxID=97485 RepID=A0AB34IE35_PRYPA